jgi:DHA1 family tetracycline resistance protein-like MFS transporter
VGYVLFGIGGNIAILFLSRIIDGLTGGDFSIAFAYIADTTEPSERPKIFGQVGAISGVSFIIGPVVGGLASKISLEAPVYLAAILTVVAIVWGYFFLPESLKPSEARTQLKLSELNPFEQLGNVLKIKALRPLLALTVLYGLPFAVLGSNYGILILDTLHWDASGIGFILLTIGVVDIIVQGWLVGKLLPLFGSKPLLITGLVLQAVAYGLLGLLVFAPSSALMIVATLVYAFSSGLVEPTLSGLTSEAVTPGMQGVVGGASQSLQSICRVVGPLWVGLIYTQFSHALPYWLNMAIMGLGILLVLSTFNHSSSPNKSNSNPEVQLEA